MSSETKNVDFVSAMEQYSTNWQNFSNDKKLEIANQFEQYVSALQHRDARKILPDSQKRSISDLFESGTIYLNVEDLEFFETLASVFHDGFVRYVSDFFYGKTGLITLSPIDINKLIEEYSLSNVMLVVAKNIDNINNCKNPDSFSTAVVFCSYVEQVAFRETAQFLSTLIIKKVKNDMESVRYHDLDENLEHLHLWFKNYQRSLDYLKTYKDFIKTHNYAEKYNFVLDSVRRKCLLDQIDDDIIKKFGNFKDDTLINVNEHATEFFDNNFKIFAKIDQLKDENASNEFNEAFAKNFLTALSDKNLDYYLTEETDDNLVN